MWAQRHGSVKRLSIGLIGLALLWSWGADRAMAQATPPADTGGARERELRDQLKNILQELEELQQQKDGARPEERGQQGEHRGLARAVRTEQSENDAGFDLECDARERASSTKVAGNVFYREVMEIGTCPERRRGTCPEISRGRHAATSLPPPRGPDPTSSSSA